MLIELSIRNFAIIDELTIPFEDGLTVLTGETGAGKSIIIDAIQLLTGGRGSQEFIRHGAKKAELEGMFVIEHRDHPVFSKLQQCGIISEDGTIILRREMNRNGKSICRVNGTLVTIAILREIGSQLVDIHGQHDHQELLVQKRHIHLLDQFGGEAMSTALTNYQELYDRYSKIKRKVEADMTDEQQVAQRIDLYSFQLKEIDDAAFVIGEEEALEEEKLKLQHYHRLFERIQTASESISGDMKALDWVGSAMSDLEDAASIDKQFQPHAEHVSTSFYLLQDVAHELTRIVEQMEYDPNRLNEVETRLSLLQSLKRKYGSSIEEILLYRDQVAETLERLMHRDAHLEKTQEKLNQIVKDLEVEANELSILRKTIAEQLKMAIMQQLQELHMEKSTFDVQIQQLPPGKFHVNGMDEVSFQISTNVGEPMKSLAKIASGGELSRIMLALKTIFSKHQSITSIIFDEVDTGVSGRVAQAIAEKIAMIASNSQVLCITHLPQVAAMADQHYVIQKNVQHERTTTKVIEIMGADRTKELSRMLSGTEITTLTLEHANELLTLAENRKKEMIQ